MAGLLDQVEVNGGLLAQPEVYLLGQRALARDTAALRRPGLGIVPNAIEYARENPIEAGATLVSMSGVEPLATAADAGLAVNDVARALRDGRWWDAGIAGATGAASVALPFVPYAALTFAGKGAKTADMAALGRAQDLESAGAGADDIWRETGWGRGADGEWRFEIDDSGASLDMAAVPGAPDIGHVAFQRIKDVTGLDADGAVAAMRANPQIVADAQAWARERLPAPTVPVFDAVQHDALARAYPDNEWRIGQAQYNTAGGSFDDATNTIRIGDVQNLVARNRYDPRSVALHELQHGVQYQEGFGTGGSPSLADPDAYWRLSGEVEARNAEHRMDWPAEQRRETPPWWTEDVPRDQQIVTRAPGVMASTGGGVMDLPMDTASRMARADEMFPIEAYHGAQRLDRLLEKPGLDPKRATSGPMPFFTDSTGLASSYAGKKMDTSRSLEGDGLYGEWFKVRPKGAKKDVPFDEAWYRYSPEERKNISENLSKIGYVDNEYSVIGIGGDNVAGASKDHWDYKLKEHRGNALAAARDVWLDSGNLFDEEEKFMEVLRLAGLKDVKYDSPNLELPGVLPARLRIDSPLHTDVESVKKVLPVLKAAAKGKRGRSYGVDMWDKNATSGADWIARVEDDIANGTTHAWTSIPDWATDALRKEGYDGIIDVSGKGGGDVHKVFIPFDPSQVRSRFAAFDPAKRDSANLLAGIAAGGLLSPLALDYYLGDTENQ